MRIFSAAIFVCCVTLAVTQHGSASEEKDKARISELKKLIEEKRKELAKLEIELEKLDPPGVVEVGTFKPNEMAVGQVGRFEYGNNVVDALRVEQVLEGYVLTERVGNGRGPTTGRYLVKCDTKGIVDGKTFEAGERYRVTGTARVGGQTFFVLEVWKKAPEKK